MRPELQLTAVTKTVITAYGCATAQPSNSIAEGLSSWAGLKDGLPTIICLEACCWTQSILHTF